MVAAVVYVTDNSDNICSDLWKNPRNVGVGIDVVVQSSSNY